LAASGFSIITGSGFDEELGERIVLWCRPIVTASTIPRGPAIRERAAAELLASFARRVHIHNPDKLAVRQLAAHFWRDPAHLPRPHNRRPYRLQKP
jgi:hypothetical protein